VLRRTPVRCLPCLRPAWHSMVRQEAACAARARVWTNLCAGVPPLFPDFPARRISPPPVTWPRQTRVPLFPVNLNHSIFAVNLLVCPILRIYPTSPRRRQIAHPEISVISGPFPNLPSATRIVSVIGTSPDFRGKVETRISRPLGLGDPKCLGEEFAGTSRCLFSVCGGYPWCEGTNLAGIQSGALRGIRPVERVAKDPARGL
jgi:hypothetical protein